MKPHIYRVMGIWHCVNRKGFVDVYYGDPWRGLGFTPSLAYEDWKLIQRMKP